MSIDFAARSAARRASHDATTAPRWRPKHNELTHFAITERQGPDPDEEPSGPVNRCRLCAAEGVGMPPADLRHLPGRRQRTPRRHLAARRRPAMTEFQVRLIARLESEWQEGIDRAAVARRLGVSVAAISDWINRGLWPRPQTHAALARFLRVPPSTMAAWFPEEERRRRQAGNKPAPVEAT